MCFSGYWARGIWYFIVGTRVFQESEARVNLLVPKSTRTVTESIKISG